MPGLLKVGKTTRNVADRCLELTSATGVSTPFVAAFEQFFHDCDAAEKSVHAALTHAGLRQSDNREFFRGSPNEVIRLILGIIDIQSSEVSEASPAPGEPWGGVYSDAEALEEGGGSIFADAEEAKRLHIMAVQLGAPQGYQMAG
jgi:hypothetical protein